jgi:hypothetical protein
MEKTKPDRKFAYLAMNLQVKGFNVATYFFI